MFTTLREDIQTVFEKDPAARNRLEVIFYYPGLQALWAHRLAHFLWIHKLSFLARAVSHTSRFLTGIEIHPGANIGRRFFIDHGMGVVIGETADIGNDVLLYQGVVLGGTTLEKTKRHPTLEDNVVVGSAAVILGPVTIGEGVRIGANSVVVKSVPPGMTIVGVPGRIIGQEDTPPEILEHGKLPDPLVDAIRRIIKEQAKLATRIGRLEQDSDSVHTNEEARLLEIVLGKTDESDVMDHAEPERAT